MERLLKMRMKFGAKMQVAFINSRMILLISMERNNFEAKLFSQITVNDIRKDFYLAYNFISIIDELNLNTRIWTKE